MTRPSVSTSHYSGIAQYHLKPNDLPVFYIAISLIQGNPNPKFRKTKMSQSFNTSVVENWIRLDGLPFSWHEQNISRLCFTLIIDWRVVDCGNKCYLMLDNHCCVSSSSHRTWLMNRSASLRLWSDFLQEEAANRASGNCPCLLFFWPPPQSQS